MFLVEWTAPPRLTPEETCSLWVQPSLLVEVTATLCGSFVRSGKLR